MSDATIQAAIQTLIQALSSYADADVSLGDFRVLAPAKTRVAVIIPGPFTALRAGDWGQITYTWSHYVELWARFTPDSFSNIVTDRQNVVNQLYAYPTLNGTSGVTITNVSSSPPIFLWQKGQSKDAQPQFVGFRLTVETKEMVNYDGSGEFA